MMTRANGSKRCTRSTRSMTGRGSHGRVAAIVAALALLASDGVAHAADWRFTFTPYLWATDVGMDASIDDRKVLDTEIPVSDLVKDLDATVQFRFEAQRGDMGLAIDLFDVAISDETTGLALPDGAGNADLNSDVDMTIFDAAGLYDIRLQHASLTIFYGTRIIGQSASIDATLTPSGGTAVSQRYESAETFVDGLVGLRFTQVLSRHWSCALRADTSAGGTDYTWSLGPTVSYAFGSSGRYSLTAGYRHMTINFADDPNLDTSLTLSGFLLGLRTTF